MAGTLRDCVYGLAIGDALGVPFEFKARDSFSCTDMVGYGTHNQPAGTWSDDTAMALATCDSIRECGGIDIADMRRRFEQWIFGGAYAVGGVVFDYGNATYQALSTGRGCSGEFNNGNGSLMRIAPLAFTDADDAAVREVSAITHAHRTSKNACVEAVHVLRSLAAGEMPDLSRWASIPRSEVRSGGYVLDTLNAALWCLATTDNYADCVLEAVNLGNDTDTTGCVAGALAGTWYGFDDIPSEWVDALREKDVLEACLF